MLSYIHSTYQPFQATELEQDWNQSEVPTNEQGKKMKEKMKVTKMATESSQSRHWECQISEVDGADLCTDPNE